MRADGKTHVIPTDVRYLGLMTLVWSSVDISHRLSETLSLVVV